MNNAKRFLLILLSLILSFGMLAAPVSGASPVRSVNALVTLEPVEAVVVPGETASFMLTAEGLGNDLYNNQIASMSFSSSDSEVFDVPLSIDTLSGLPIETGLQYLVDAYAVKTGSSVITATVTDFSGNVYTASLVLTAKGIVAQPKSITLEVGESCVIFANRYGFTDYEASTQLTWSKTPDFDGITAIDWISIGVHGGTYRQKEGYYVTGNSAGTGTVTVSLRSGNNVFYSDTINVTVIDKKSLTIKQDGAEVNSPVYLSDENNTAILTAEAEGFDPVITWESSRPDLVSVSQDSPASAVIEKMANSDTIVAIKATAADGNATRTKSIYVILSSDAPSLRITSPALCSDSETRNITIRQGDTLSLSALTSGVDETAAIWTATTEGGRVPLKLNSTVGKSITVTGRLSSASPVAVTASDGGVSDTVYITVLPDGEKGVKITCDNLGADGVIVLNPYSGTTQLRAELTGFTEPQYSDSDIIWTAAIADNSENYSTNTERPPVFVALSDSHGLSTTVTAQTPSFDFAKITVKIIVDNVIYTDTVYVKVPNQEIIDNANIITLYQGEKATLGTVNGELADWMSNNQKVYFGDVSRKPTYVYSYSSATLNTLSRNGFTINPCLIKAGTDGQYSDSVYVCVVNGNRTRLTFDLNGGYGTAPDPVILSSDDSIKSIVLPEPEAFYPSDYGEYEFYGWSEYSNAGESVSSADRPIYFPGQTYSVTADKTLYAIWTKKAENALFCIRINEDIPPEPASQQIDSYSKSGIYIEGALKQAGFYYNVNGVESHLMKNPADADIARALSIDSISYNPDTDRIIWYAVKRSNNDAAGLPDWHVDGVLLRGNKVSLTYDKNISVSNLTVMPNPPRVFQDIDSAGSSTFAITESIPRCSDFVFVGWNTEPDGSGQWYSYDKILYNGFSSSEPVYNSVTITEDTTLYAIWTGINIRVPYYETAGFPDEYQVSYAGRDYTLNDNNNRCVQVVDNSAGADLPEMKTVIPGYVCRWETSSSVNANNISAVTYTAVFEPAIELAAHSLTLGGDIGVNFYFRFADVTDDILTQFTVDGKTVTVPVSESREQLLDDGTTAYRFTCNVAAAQTGERITGRVYAGGNSLDFEYSVYDYLTELSEDQEYMQNADLEGLARAIAVYGYYANELFNYYEGLEQHMLFDDSGMQDVTAQSLIQSEPVLSNTDGEINYVGSTLVLRTKTAIRHYFTLPGGKTIDDYTFVLGEGDNAEYLTPVLKGSYYYVEISDIPSAELGDETTVTVLNGEGTAVSTWRYSALSYAYLVLSSYENGGTSVSAQLADAVKALVLYYYAAQAYFAVHTAD